MSEGFGKASLENTFDGYKFFKLRTPDPKKNEEKTELILRILPSMKSYRDSGTWRFFYGQHYGYQGNNPRDPSKPRARPFGCIQKKNKDKSIKVHCPKCDQIEAKRKQYDARAEDLLKSSGLDKDSREFKDLKQTDTKLKVLGEWLRKHNCDKKFWINVMSLNGEFGVLQLSYKTSEDVLLPLLKELRDKEKVDALDPMGGVFLRFTRTGKNPQVVDAVEVYTETVQVDGRTFKEYKSAKMTPQQIERALKVCPDLAKDVVKMISAETIQALVDCNGDPDVVDKIWPQESKKSETPATSNLDSSDVPPPDDEPPAEDEVPAQQAAPQAPPKTEPPAPPAPEVDEEELELERKLAAKRAAKAAAKAPTASPAPGLGAPSVDNEAAFLEQFQAK